MWNNGPNTEYDLRNRRIEPGDRECVALIVAPNFVPQIRLTSTSNWFDLTGKHAEQTTETTDMVRMARKLQTARSALNRICDTHAFPPNELDLLSTRLDQLEALLPMRTHQVTLALRGRPDRFGDLRVVVRRPRPSAAHLVRRAAEEVAFASSIFSSAPGSASRNSRR